MLISLHPLLQITDEWVKRILINAHGIEKVGLAKTRAEAQGCLAEYVGGGGVFLTADNFRVTKYSYVAGILLPNPHLDHQVLL